MFVRSSNRFTAAMWCTRWFLPLLLLPLPTAPPYFLVLFLLTLALHARPCFYCIILLAALFLSSCYWQSFPLDARLSVPWANNVTTFSEALNASMPPHLTTFNYAPPIVRVADRCWCDFASGLFDPYDVQNWEKDSIQRAIAHIEKQWKHSLEPDGNTSADPTASAEHLRLEQQSTSTAPNVTNIRNEALSSILRSFLGVLFHKPESSSTTTPPSANTTTPPDTLAEPSAAENAVPTDPLLVPGQLDMRPFGFELIFDFRWSRRS